MKKRRSRCEDLTGKRGARRASSGTGKKFYIALHQWSENGELPGGRAAV